MNRRQQHLLNHAVVLVACMAGAAACDLAAPSAPSPSAPVTTAESFSGSFTAGGSSVHAFTVTATGKVDVQLTTVSPLSSLAIGVAVGSWDGSACSVLNIVNPDARTGEVALRGTTVAGDYCVTVYDSGNVGSGVTVGYTVSISHP